MVLLCANESRSVSYLHLVDKPYLTSFEVIVMPVWFSQLTLLQTRRLRSLRYEMFSQALLLADQLRQNNAINAVATSSTGSSSSTGYPTSTGAPDSGAATSTGESSSIPTSTSASNGALRSSLNAGLVVSVIGLVASLSF